ADRGPAPTSLVEESLALSGRRSDMADVLAQPDLAGTPTLGDLCLSVRARRRRSLHLALSGRVSRRADGPRHALHFCADGGGAGARDASGFQPSVAGRA